MKTFKLFLEHMYELKPYNKKETPEDRIGDKIGVHNFLTKHYKYSTKDKPSILKYIQGGSRSINQHVSNVAPDTSLDSQQDITNHAKNLSMAMKTHKTPGAMIVHHGVKRNNTPLFDDMINNKKEQHLSSSSFLSGSIDPQTAHSFKSMYKRNGENNYTSHVLHIHIPKGSYGGYVGHISDKPFEKEFIINKGSHLYIHPNPIHVEKNSDDREGTTYHWRAHLIHDGVKDV